MAVTTPIPSTTRANAVYLLSKEGAGAVQMKKDVEALAGSSSRAIDTVPATCTVSLNSGRRVVTSAFCFCVRGADRVDTIPVCTTNPLTIR